MKKAFCVVLAMLLVVGLLASCGKKELTPIEKAQARAVEIGEQYLNFEISGTEARKLLDDIKVPETETGKGQIALSADIGYLAYVIAKQGSTYKEVEERVKQIAGCDYTE